MFNSKNNLLIETRVYYWGEETDTDISSSTYQYNQYNFPSKRNSSEQGDYYSWSEEWNFAYECN
jgi:hypothetical protein